MNIANQVKAQYTVTDQETGQDIIDFESLISQCVTDNIQAEIDEDSGNVLFEFVDGSVLTLLDGEWANTYGSRD